MKKKHKKKQANASKNRNRNPMIGLRLAPDYLELLDGLALEMKVNRTEAVRRSIIKLMESMHE